MIWRTEASEGKIAVILFVFYTFRLVVMSNLVFATRCRKVPRPRFDKRVLGVAALLRFSIDVWSERMSSFAIEQGEMALRFRIGHSSVCSIVQSCGK